MLSFSFWGDPPDAAIARIRFEHPRSWAQAQAQRDAAERVANLVRDAVVEHRVGVAEVEALLTRAPPSVLSFGGRLRAAWRIVFSRTQEIHP